MMRIFARAAAKSRLARSFFPLSLAALMLLTAAPTSQAQQDPQLQLRERRQSLVPTEPQRPARPVHGVRYRVNPIVEGKVRAMSQKPTCSSPSLSYFGGPVISNVQPVVVFWSKYVNAALTDSTTGIAQFLADLDNSTVMNVVHEYSSYGLASSTNQWIGDGSSTVQAYTLTPSICATNSTCTVTDSQIQTELNAQIAAGNLPPPTYDPLGNPNTVYMTYFPPNVTVEGPEGAGESCQEFCAYHYTGTYTPNSAPLIYGVLMDEFSSACATGCGYSATAMENETYTSSHEFAESITDADIGLDTTYAYATPGAWGDNNNNCGEIADICDTGNADNITIDNRTWAVTELWSNAENQCESTAPTPIPPFVFGGSSQVTTGAPFNFTLTAETVAGVANTAYKGTVHFTSSDSGATLPADYTYLSGDAGVHSFHATLVTGSSQTITATDSANGDLTSTTTFTLTAAALSTTTTLSSSQNPSFTTQPTNGVSFTATVTSNSNPVNSGTVTFQDNSSTIAGCGNVALSGGQAVCNTAFSTEGEHPISALYSGFSSPSVSYLTSSGVLTQEVDHHTVQNGNQWCNPGAVTIPATQSAASPYPSRIFVTGAGTNVGAVTVMLNGINSSNMPPTDLLLVSPSGAAMVPFASVGDTSTISGVNITLDDSAGNLLPHGSPLISGTFRPSAYNGSALVFPSPAPLEFGYAASHGSATLASTFSGTAANGTWSLYAMAGTTNGADAISGGWCVNISAPQVDVPNVVGDTQSAAATAITGAGLIVGTTGSAYSNTIAAGAVVSTNPTAGTPVNPGSAVNLVISLGPAPVATTVQITGVPSAVDLGGSFNFTVTVYDQFNNIATGYTGTMAFTSTDAAATLPPNYTFTPGDAGVHQFSAMLNTVGKWTITATDTLTTSLTATTAQISVSIPGFVVTNTNDSGTGSLREALTNAAAAGSGNITFDPSAFSSAQTITLSSGTLNIPSNATVNGPTSGTGASLSNLVTVNGNAAKVFNVASGVGGAAITNLNIASNATNNTDIIENAGSLSITSSSVTGPGSRGGTRGIYNDSTGTLTLIESTVTGNTIGQSGGGNVVTTYGAGIDISGGTVNIVASTIQGNDAFAEACGSQSCAGTSAHAYGGGIYVAAGTVTITNSTISGNAAAADSAYGGYGDYTSYGAGIDIGGGTVIINNSIVSGNTQSGDLNGTYTGTGNLIGGTVSLASLGNYGGPTQTMLPLPGSTAICAALKSNLVGSTDQRGEPNKNTSYPGYDAGTPCVDAGAVQTNYALSFNAVSSTVGPPATGTLPGTAMSPAPQVTLTESGAAFTANSESIDLTDANSDLTASPASASTSSGVATFSSLVFTNPTSSDTLTAKLPLNPSLTTPLSITAQSAGFSVGAASTTTTASNATTTFSNSSQNVTLSATVTSTQGTVNAGTVTFTVLNSGTPVGTATTSATVVSGNASVSYAIPAGTLNGTYTIQAVYNGSTDFSRSSDNTHTLTINGAMTATSASNAGATYSSSNQLVTLSATVTSAAGTVNSGTVSFSVFSGATQIGSSTSAANVSGGVASASYTLLGGTNAGTYTIVAKYTGAGGFNSSSSDNSHSLTVSAAGSATAASNQTVDYSSNSQSVALTAMVTSTAGIVNGGTVTFTVLNGTTVIGTATTSTAVASGSASVSYTLPAGTAAGTYTIQAVYNGSTNFTGSSDNKHSLTVLAVPVASISPNNGINFGTLYLGSAAAKTVTITNTGDLPLTLSNPVVQIVQGGNSDEFDTVNPCPKTLAAGKSCNMTVTFIAGPFYTQQTAKLMINDNAAGSPQSVPLTALVIDPKPSLNVSTLNFGAEKEDTSSKPKSVTLTNTGATPLMIQNIGVTGADPSDFVESNACPSSLAPKTSCTIDVTFKPSTKGSLSANLVLQDNAQTAPQTVKLSGTGD